MTPQQIELVQCSFGRLGSNGEMSVADFYRRLFVIAPNVRPMFPADLGEQGARLLRLVALAVGRLDSVGTLVETLQAMGARHVAYGAKDEQYDIVGQALLETLESYLSEAFDADTCESWTVAYGALAGAMIEGARQRRAFDEGRAAA